MGDLSARVLEWGGSRLRDLPWRQTRDPWAVLVSEVMLQQTQVARVIPAWHRFLDRFPDPATCAAVSLADVLREWQGLGYPRRARDLHATAAVVRSAGRFPDTLDELLGLPGVGPYTARAVLVFAFERDEAVVDTNIARVLARVAGRSLSRREVQAHADALVPTGWGWLWNQALMDLGATVCRPTPNCGDCPVAMDCAWRGAASADPASGSAGVSHAQAPFKGSRREARGRVLASLGAGPQARHDLPAEIVAGLVTDGLVTTDGQTVWLAGDQTAIRDAGNVTDATISSNTASA